MKGCPHAWHVYALWPWGNTVHLHRWSESKGDWDRQTFVDPGLLVRI